MSELTQALERAADAPEVASVLAMLERSKPEIARTLPSGVDFERFERVVRTEVRRTPALLDCDPSSFMAAVLWAAQLNLEPGPLQHVHLIPHKREVTFVIGYRGYIELAYRSGQVKDVSAELVHDGDTFRVAQGTSPKITHEPLGPPAEREIVAAYAVAHLRTGGTVFRVIYADDWERARKASALASTGRGPWKDDEPAMIRKTAIRRLEPLLPKSTAFGDALAMDEQAATWEPTPASTVEPELAPAEAATDGA